MKQSPALIYLSWLTVLLGGIASAGGLLWRGGPGSFIFTTLHGRQVEMFGEGLYQNDTFFKAPILLGTDVIFLFVGLPALAGAIFWYRRGSLRGGLLLAGLLTCFLYQAASLTFGVAYNRLFLVYVAYFGASFYALLVALTAFDLQELKRRILPSIPWRRLAFFMFIAALSPLVWLVEAVAALVSGSPPILLGSYTTDVTTAIDISLIFPACILAGVKLLRRAPSGVVLGAVLLTLLSLVGLVVAGQTVAQLALGVQLTPGEVAAYAAPFVILALIAIWLLRSILANVEPAG